MKSSIKKSTTNNSPKYNEQYKTALLAKVSQIQTVTSIAIKHDATAGISSDVDKEHPKESLTTLHANLENLLGQYCPKYATISRDLQNLEKDKVSQEKKLEKNPNHKSIIDKFNILEKSITDASQSKAAIRESIFISLEVKDPEKSEVNSAARQRGNTFINAATSTIGSFFYRNLALSGDEVNSLNTSGANHL